MLASPTALRTPLRRILALAPLPFLMMFAAHAGAQDVAATQSSSAAPVHLDAISVTATRGEKSVFETPQSVSIIDSTAIERRGTDTLRDLTIYEPGVSVGSSPVRTGADSFVIRGIDQNRIRMQIDGVRVPETPESNAGSGLYTRNFVDLNTLKGVEIVRGPASALYGSDAIGGVVAYTTKDPADYLAEVGKDWTLQVRGGYDSADKGFHKAAVVAGRAAWVEGMVSYSRRDSSEVKPNGRLSANPIDDRQDNILAKLVLRPTDTDSIRFTVESFRRDTDVTLNTELSSSVLASDTNDETRRLRFSVNGAHTDLNGFVDEVKWNVFTTRLSRDENNIQNRLSMGRRSVRYSMFEFNQDVIGADVQLVSDAKLFGVSNRFTYGASFEHQKSSRPRDRYDVSLPSGAITRSIASYPGAVPEVFPNKNYPDSKLSTFGAFVQDEITLGNLSIMPALRYDYFKLKPEPDAMFYNSNISNFRVTDVSDWALSPKLAVSYKLDDRFVAYGLYAHGFRIPPFDTANMGYTNAGHGYEILPNPNLKPETSNSFELGLRGRFENGSSFGVSAFYNMYKDFISQEGVGYSPAGLLQYQNRNLQNVRIWGIEANGEVRLSQQFALFGNIAFARGEDDDTGLPIDTVAPVTGVLGASFTHDSGFGAELLGRGAASHNRRSTATGFQTPSYVIADANFSYDFEPTLSLNAGVKNIFDRKYFNYYDMLGATRTSTTNDRYAQPGRTFFVNATVRW